MGILDSFGQGHQGAGGTPIVPPVAESVAPPVAKSADAPSAPSSAPQAEAPQASRVGDARPNPETGFREVLKQRGKHTRWISEAESYDPEKHVGMLLHNGFFKPTESLTSQNLEEVKSQSRAREVEALTPVNAMFNSGTTKAPKEERAPKEPTARERALEEQSTGAPLTRKPWNANGSSPSIVDAAHQHIAHLEGFIAQHQDTLASGLSSEARNQASKAFVHLMAARQALSDARQARGGGRVPARDSNGDLIKHPDGTQAMVNAPQDDLTANSHIKAATKLISMAHQALLHPEVRRTTKDVVVPQAATTAGGMMMDQVTPEDNEGAAQGLRERATRGRRQKTSTIAGQRFDHKDPWVQEQFARIEEGIQNKDPQYMHIAKTFHHIVGRNSKGETQGTLKGQQWVSAGKEADEGLIGIPSPHATGVVEQEVVPVGGGKPFAGATNAIPKTGEDLDQIDAEKTLAPHPNAPAPGKYKAEKVGEAAAAGQAIRDADAAQTAADKTARETTSKEGKSFAGLSPEAKAAKIKELTLAQKVRDAEAGATTAVEKDKNKKEKSPQELARLKERRAAKKAERDELKGAVQAKLKKLGL